MVGGIGQTGVGQFKCPTGAVRFLRPKWTVAEENPINKQKRPVLKPHLVKRYPEAETEPTHNRFHIGEICPEGIRLFRNYQRHLR